MTPIKVAMATKVWPPAGVFSSTCPEEGEEVRVVHFSKSKHTHCVKSTSTASFPQMRKSDLC